MPLAYARLDALAVQQDYLWFLAALGWLAVAGLALRPGRTGCPPWIWTLAGSGVLLAAFEIALQSAPRADLHAPRADWDVALAAASVLSVGGFLWCALAAIPSREWRAGWRGAGLVGLATVLAAKWWWPAGAACALVLLQAGAIMAVLRFDRSPGRALLSKPLAAGLMVLPLLAAHGPIAEFTRQAVRWSELTYFGALAALSQFAAALWIGRRIWTVRAAGAAPAAAGRDRREMKIVAALIGLWLAVGLGLAAWSGAVAGEDYETALARRARTAAAVLEVDNLEACAGAALRIERTLVVKQEEGWDHLIGVAPHLRHPAFRDPQLRLSRIEKSNPDVRFVHIATLRHGYLTSFVFPSEAPGTGDKVSLLAPASERDLLWWIDRQRALEGPMRTTLGPLIRVREPLVTSGGRMLGWLLMDFGVPDWVANRAHARRQMFAVVGLGAALAVLVLQLRLRNAEHDEARRSAQAAASSERLKTEFLAKVSHELRTPIQSVVGYGELLATLPLETEPRRWLAALRTHGEMMVRLVNDLLDLSTLQTGMFRFAKAPFDLAILCRDIADDFRPRAAAKGLVFATGPDLAGSCWVVTDHSRLRQILANLAANAVKYTPSGRVTLGVTLESGPDPSRGIARFFVADTGPGIAPQDHARIFEAFVRLETAGVTEGTGVGLALAKSLAAGLGGTLAVESDGATGTTFHLTLPVELTRPPWRRTPGALSLEDHRILVADDNSLVRELYLTHLRRCGARVETAADGSAALERALAAPFDVVIVDLQMPLLDGFALTRRLRQHPALAARRPRIVGVSARSDVDDRRQALAAGMDEFLVKPVPLGVLAAVVAGLPATTTPASDPGDYDHALREKLVAQFRTELPKLLSDLSASVGTGDRATLRLRAHYLKNGADILRFDMIRAVCDALESIAAQGSPDDARAQLAALRHAIEHDAAHLLFRPDSPADPAKN